MVVAYRRAGSAEELAAVYDEALGGDVSTVIEVTTDRVENERLHRRIEAAVADVLAR